MIITSQVEVRSRNVKTVGERGDRGEEDGMREKCVGDVLETGDDLEHNSPCLRAVMIVWLPLYPRRVESAMLKLSRT